MIQKKSLPETQNLSLMSYRTWGEFSEEFGIDQIKT